jgi:hypothetical protein
MMQPIEVRRFEVRRFVGTTPRKPARALTKERKNCIIIFDALLFRARMYYGLCLYVLVCMYQPRTVGHLNGVSYIDIRGQVCRPITRTGAQRRTDEARFCPNKLV